MRTIRRLLREFLLRMPGRWGETFLLPWVRRVYDQLPFLDFRVTRYAASEAKHIRSYIANGGQEYTIVYDCEAIGSLNFATLINMLLIARYMIAHEVFTRMFIVLPEGRSDNDQMDNDEYEDRVIEFVRISETLLDEDRSATKVISAMEFSAMIDATEKKSILFSEFSSVRRPFFRDCFNVFNNLMARQSNLVRSDVLFSFDDFAEYLPEKFVSKKYITWHCRFASIDPGRQTESEEFLECYRYLRERFRHHEIVIVSDNVGCQHYMDLAQSLEIKDVEFSKDVSPDFLGDSALIMRSDFFFWFRGGGIDAVPRASMMAYEMLGPLMNEVFWRKNCHLTSWQSDEQKFVVLDKHQFVDNRALDLKKIGCSWNTD